MPPTPPACWNGTSSDFETRLIGPRGDYALEQLRARFFALVTTNTTPNRSARAALQMALETELRAVLVKVIDVAPDVETSNVCERRRFLEVDVDMRPHSYLIAPALAALVRAPDIPVPYIDLVRRYLGSPYPRYRMSALSAMLCLAAAVGA